jgi:hypothetical protein
MSGHLAQCILPFSTCCPHQKFATIESNSSHRTWGRRKQLKMYVGIDCTTALIRTSFPAMDNLFLPAL